VDFTLTETQVALRDLADRILADHADVDRVRAVERAAHDAGDGVDRDLWLALAGAGVLRAFAEDDDGDERPDVVAAAQVCEAQGRHVVPVPLWPALAALLALRRAGPPRGSGDPTVTDMIAAVADGRELVTVALAEAGQIAVGPGAGTVVADGDGRLTGTKLVVPAAPAARWAVVPVVRPQPALHLVDLTGPGVAVERVVTTNRSLAGHVHLAGAPSTHVGDEAAVERLLATATVLVAALHVGVCAEAVVRTSDHLMSREQFGRPLAAFQGTVLRIADAYVDSEAMRVTTLQAAWRLETGRPAAEAVATAKWWAAEAGHRVVHATQHLHGGIGADVDYPVHRYFLWGKQLGDTLGGAGAHATELGRLLAAGVRA
jgi:3-oxocholest-4-en-26-oyl-CoA dehydrogenase beta subunit